MAAEEVLAEEAIQPRHLQRHRDEAARLQRAPDGKADARQSQLHVVPLAGGAIRTLSTEPGMHNASFAKNASVYVDSWSNAHTPPQIALPSAVLTTTAAAEAAQAFVRKLPRARRPRVITIDAVPNSVGETFVPAELESNGIAYLQYTSGSTSTPKGAALTHASVLHNVAWFDDGWEHTPDAVGINWLPAFHDLGLVYGILAPLWGGFLGLQMSPIDVIQRPALWLKALSASIGVAVFPDHGRKAEELIQHADTAMYVAKDAGRNGYQFFMKEMNARVSRRMFLENNLRRALERDELFLVYQPQIDAASGQVAGVEALVRWRHPDEGLIPPDRFIPVAEDCGLIEPLGAWVLHQACRQLQDWTQLGETDLMMAINISPMQFRKSGFIDTVRHALSASGVDPARVELEITETLLMQPLKDLDNRLRELADMGLTFALDDFGTGYSSLGYLKRLPISRIKLDKSFVADLPGDVEDEAITRATLSMAKDLGLRCVAEGVETEAQQRFLTQRGCDALQGYLFARPMPADECRDWLRRYRRGQLRAAVVEPLRA